MNTLSDIECLQHLAYHVFLPPQLPQYPLEVLADKQVSLKISSSVSSAVQRFKESDPENASQWGHIIHMLECFSHSIEDGLQKDRLSQDITSMTLGGMGNLCFGGVR